MTVVLQRILRKCSLTDSMIDGMNNLDPNFSHSSYVHLTILRLKLSSSKALTHFPHQNPAGTFCFVFSPEGARCQWWWKAFALCPPYPSPFCLQCITRLVGDTEAAPWRHPSDTEGLSSPGGPIDGCGSQDGLPWDHHARLSWQSFTVSAIDQEVI